MRHDLTLCAALFWALALPACEPRVTTKAASAPTETSSPTRADGNAAEEEPVASEPTEDVAPLPERVARGVCYAHSWELRGKRGYGTDTSAETIAHMKDVGVEWLSITPFGWMSTLSSTTIGGEHAKGSFMPPGAESKDRVAGVFTQARAAGMKVILKPHIWIGRGEWRGSIAPEGGDWASWWKSYRTFILYYAEMAERLDAEAFVVGVELVSALEAHPEEFARTVAEVRKVYSGKITYSANWDELHPPKLWRQLDAVGVQLYPPLSDDPAPSIADLCAALKPHLETWTTLAADADRPLWLTEVGYKSAPTAVKEPFGWPENLPKELRASDERLQARAYRALFEEVARHERVEAVYLWKYFTDPDTDEEGDFGFSPRGKQAEEVMRKAFAPGK